MGFGTERGVGELQGIVYDGRKGGLSAQKAAFARPARDAELAHAAGTDLGRAVELVGPDSLIGAAAKGGAFSERVVKAITKAFPYIVPPCQT